VPDTPAIEQAAPPPPEQPFDPSLPPVTNGDEANEEDQASPTMAAEIEKLLQYRLTRSSEFMLRTIHIRDSASGGVIIEIDGQFYHSVADIEDEAVKNFIQEVIQEWEARQ
jgi:hypothetical protein